MITCSALKRAYRDELLSGRPAATMVFLEVSKEVLVQRLSHRLGHFFPEKLLDSQLAAFEPPDPDERVTDPARRRRPRADGGRDRRRGSGWIRSRRRSLVT